MKHLFAAIVGVADVAVIAVLLGLGFGSGALDVTGSATDQHYVTTVGSNNGGTEDAISFHLSIVEGANGQPVISSMLSGGQSTPINFAVGVDSSGNCGNAGQPAWDGGDDNGAWYTYGLYDANGNPVQSTVLQDGHSKTGSVYTVSENGTNSVHSNLYYCFYRAPTLGLGGGNVQSTNFINQPFWNHSVSFIGLYPAVTFKLYFQTSGPFCSGTSIISPAVGACLDSANALQRSSTAFTNTGVWTATPSASVSMFNGQASFVPLNPGQIAVNGGKISLSVTTGYDGPAAYQLIMDCPQPRACGGQPDPSFPAITVPNFCNGCLESWTIPSNASQNNSQYGVAWNTWNIVLQASYLNQQSTKWGIAISTQYEAGMPVVTYSTASGSYYPDVGETVTLTVYVNQTNLSANTANVSLQLYYLQPGKAAYQAPPCGASWISTNCPFSESVSTTHNGNSTVATLTFVVNPPLGDTAVGVTAQGGTVTGQPGPVANYLILIKPSGCVAGSPCDPNRGLVNLWHVYGPVLLTIALILTVAFFLILWPFDPKVRVIIGIVAGVGLVAILALGVWGPVFQPIGVGMTLAKTGALAFLQRIGGA